MAIGQHECKNARDTGIFHAVEIGLDEAWTALEESFHDLTDEQVSAFLATGKNNIAWIVMHCLDNLDEYCNGAMAGDRVHSSESLWNLAGFGPQDTPTPDDDCPPVVEMLDRLRAIRAAAVDNLARFDDETIAGRLDRHPHKTLRTDFYMRTIYHTISHTRQIWLLRGALGLVDGPWPEQHWA